MIDLNDENYVLLASKAYDKPSALTSEFEEDLQRILYIKRLLSKYQATGILKERLLLNHLVIFGNVFGVEMANRLLWLKLETKDWHVIKPFLLYLNMLSKRITSVRGMTVETDDIVMDQKAIEALRTIDRGRG
jgi:hypothetical protein